MAQHGNNLNIALVSPSSNSYSETFIQAHKNRLQGTIHYYYGGLLPNELENGELYISRKQRILHILKGYLRLNEFTVHEQAVINSFKANKIQLVFAEYGGTGETLTDICRLLQIPLIVHFHGYDATHKNELAAHKNYIKLFAYAKAVICVSGKMERNLIEMGCPGEKIHRTVCGPNEIFYENTPHFNKQQFMAAGRFTDKKAPYYLILAFREVVKKFPDAQLIIAGEGELSYTCQNLIRFFKLEKNIQLPGMVTPEQFSNYLNDSMALVQHSVNTPDGDSEGTPVVIVEAGAAGLPVIATRHAGIKEVIHHEETGLLCEEHDVYGMADHMLKLLSNPMLAREMGNNARARIKSHYTLNMHMDLLNSLVKKAIK